MLRRSLRVLVPVLLLLAGASLPAQRAWAAGRWYTYLHMASCNDILAMPDTVWLATGEAGLFRYLRSADRFEPITREPGGLANNTINALAFDRSGRLWAGTAGKGASRLSANLKTWDLVNAFDGLPSDSVNVLSADGDTIWIGTTRGIALWNGKLIAGSVPDIGTPSPFRSNNVTGIVVHGDTLLVSTTDGVYLARLSQSLGSWSSLDTGLGSTNVHRIDSNGTDVFAHVGTTLYRLDLGSGTWVTLTTASQVKYLRGAFGRLYAATRDSLCVFANGGWVSVPGAPRADATTTGGLAVSADPTGRIFASRGGQLYDQQPAGWVTHTPPGPAGNQITNILAIGGEVWAHPVNDGVSRFSYASGVWTNWLPCGCGPAQNTSFMNPIYSYTLQLDRGGHLWTSHWDTGIERVDLRANPLYFDHAYPTWGVARDDTLSRHSDGWSSAVDSLGYVYIGGDTPELGDWEPMGIDVYDTTGAWVINWKTTNAGLGSNQVRAIAYDQVNHLVWAGFANRGISYFPIDSIDADLSTPPDRANDHQRLPTFSPITPLLTSNIFGLVAHGDSLWVLSSSDLKRVRGSTRSVQSTLDLLAQPAPTGSVHPLDVAADGSVWTASVEGVRHYIPGGGHEDFTADNTPLADNEVRSVSVDPVTGVVWIGTASGINAYDPGYQPPAPPKIAALHVTAYPNPARLNASGIRLLLRGNAGAYSGEIVDINGRVVKRFETSADGEIAWDGRDRDGGLVRSGVYFVHTRGGGREATARVVVLR
jgi:hypothetical protein